MKLKLLIVAVLSAGLFGCATSSEKTVESKMAAETGATSQEEMVMKTREVLASNENLTDDQRTRLMGLHGQTMAKMAGLRQDITKAKMVLFKSMLAEDYKESEIRVLREKLVKLNTQKMNVMFDSMDQAKMILGKEATVEFMQQLDFDSESRVR